MTIGERIKKLRLKNDMSQVELSQKIGISKQSLYKYENGIITNIPSDKIELLADVLHTSPSYLMGWDGDTDIPSNIHPIELHRLPMLGEIACGEPRYANEDRESYIMAGTDVKADFCLRAKGDSMINARISDGDIVFIRQQDMVENGEIAAVLTNGDSEATLKRVFYYREKSLLILKAENPGYEDLVFQDEELEEVRILGKAVAFQGDVI